MNPWIQIAGYVFAFLGVLATAYYGFKAIKWKASGSVRTTDAETFWKETSDYRRELQEALKYERQEIEQERQYRQTLMAEVERLTSAKAALERASAAMQVELEQSRRAEDRCRQTVIELEDRIAELEGRG